jgi:hypothetical protein
VVSGAVDSDRRVSGRGLAYLRSHNISISHGIEEQACLKLNSAFIFRVISNRPYLTIWSHILDDVTVSYPTVDIIRDMMRVHAPDIDTIVLDVRLISKCQWTADMIAKFLPRYCNIILINANEADYQVSN